MILVLLATTILLFVWIYWRRVRNVKTFKHLQFHSHGMAMFDPNAIAAHIETGKHTISVVQGKMLYCNPPHTYEVGAWGTESGEWVRLSKRDDVIGWQTPQEVSRIMRDVQLGDMR